MDATASTPKARKREIEPPEAEASEASQDRADPRLPKDVQQRIATLAPVQYALGAGRALWEDLSQAEKDQLLDEAAQRGHRPPGGETSPGGLDPELAACLLAFQGPLGMHQALHPELSKERSTVELAEIASLIPRRCAERLDERLRVLEASDHVDPGLKPTWKGDAGELWYGDVCVRRVKLRKDSNMAVVLDAFEDQFWSNTVPNPLKGPQRLADTVQSLNDNMLNPILEFHSAHGGRSAGWRLRTNLD